jgi:hypothetical protein
MAEMEDVRVATLECPYFTGSLGIHGRTCYFGVHFQRLVSSLMRFWAATHPEWFYPLSLGRG